MNERSMHCLLSQVTGKIRYFVWVLTAGGVVYRVQVSGAASGWMLYGNQQHDVSADVQRLHEVTAFAATPLVACLGGRTGSITCVPFGAGSLSSTEAGELEAHEHVSGVFSSSAMNENVFEYCFEQCLD